MTRKPIHLPAAPPWRTWGPYWALGFLAGTAVNGWVASGDASFWQFTVGMLLAIVGPQVAHIVRATLDRAVTR